MEEHLPAKIVSGGQTGVDRAALDAAIHLEIEHGGWCPLGRMAEDGSVPEKYQLVELPTRKYWVRTERNVADSDATLILYCSELSGGTEFTFRMTVKHTRPCLKIDLTAPSSPTEIRDWLMHKAAGRTLNIAGPRESSHEGIQKHAYEFLVSVLN